ncbi:DUF2730 family protein [Gallaecimonas kandeliae]|uniref:DUF2730 family protein n=1 Tax=Gallaecimonas kandeliae TaxID=3029055 RepID=UPI0026496627|nr:DUF2730 family protein [Gallaecimonas kandeliae]WKE64350.1 DUF2730 family protein [Gallaecimonas kandeliae]
MDWLDKDLLPLYIALASLVLSVVVALLQLTFAKRTEMAALAATVTTQGALMAELERRIDDLPGEKDLHELSLKISDLKVELAAVSPALKRLERLGDLLLENELLEGKRK